MQGIEPRFAAGAWQDERVVRQHVRIGGALHVWCHSGRRTAVGNLVRAGVPRSIARFLTGRKTESVFER